MSDSVTDDPTVTALLAMTEFFMTQHPLPVNEVVRCLLAVLALQPVARVEANVRLKLGVVLSEHTSCIMQAKEHLEKAMLVSGTAANLQDVRFHAASTLSSLLASQGHYHQARGLLRGKLDATIHHPYWHIRLLLQLADLLSCEGDISGQLGTFSRCQEYTHNIGASHAHLLATLARGAVLLTQHNYTEAGGILNQASNLLESYNGSHLILLKTFYLTIQVAHLLMAGQVKTAKPHLKQLQQCVQSLSTQPEERVEPTLTSDLSTESFQWLTRSHAYITVYLVSVLHSVQAGFTDKALSYVERALQLINQEKVSTMRPSGVLNVLRAHVLEQSVQCLLMRGECVTAASQLQDIVDTCHSHHILVYSHRAVLHTLLGLYSFATASLDRAIVQFQTALQHTNCKELHILISLNLAICFMKIGDSKQTELDALMTSVDSEGTNITCQSLQSAISYVKGLYSFINGRLHDAKRQLRETLTVANSSDLNKLTSCSLLLLGQIFLALGNTKETLDMVTPALQLSVKMPENRLQVWAASLLADLYRTVGEGEKEKLLRQQSRSILDHLTEDMTVAVNNKQHQLLQWTIGEWPATHSTIIITNPSPIKKEVKGHEKTTPTSTYSSPTPRYSSSTPRRNSVTVNGSPIALKTPEILLKRVESPIRVTPPKSLLTMATKLQTTPTRLQAPPPTNMSHTPTHHNMLSESQIERETNIHTSDNRKEHNVNYHTSPHQTDSPPVNKDIHRHQPSPQTDTISPSSSMRQSPHTRLQSPHHHHHHHSSPTQPRPSPTTHSPRQPHKMTPPHINYIPQQDNLSHHHSPLHQTKPSLPTYHEHSLVHSVHPPTQRSHTPPSLTPQSLPTSLTPQSLPTSLTPQSLPTSLTPQSLPTSLTPQSLPQSLPTSLTPAPQSPKLHHLSPSHTPPPTSRVPIVHRDYHHHHHHPAVEQHMLQTQQQLLWQQSYQNHQRMVQTGTYYQQPVPPHQSTIGLSPHYIVQSGMSLPAHPQLSHTLQHTSPSRNSLTHLSTSIHPNSGQLPPNSGRPVSHMTFGPPSHPEAHHHYGYQRR